MPDHNRPCLRSAKYDARARQLLIAHANSGPLEEPAEAAARGRRKAAQMLALRWFFHSADNEATNTRFQCGVRLELPTRCCIGAHYGGVSMSQSFYPSAASYPTMHSSSPKNGGANVFSLHELNSPGNAHHAGPGDRTSDVGGEPDRAQQ